MKKFHLKSDRWGNPCELLEAESAESLADGMKPNFKTWAEELWEAQDQFGEQDPDDWDPTPDKDQWIKSTIEDMYLSFIEDLEEIEDQAQEEI